MTSKFSNYVPRLISLEGGGNLINNQGETNQKKLISNQFLTRIKIVKAFKGKILP